MQTFSLFECERLCLLGDRGHGYPASSITPVLNDAPAIDPSMLVPSQKCQPAGNRKGDQDGNEIPLPMPLGNGRNLSLQECPSS